jgi:single-stranded DNA-binding protein
MIDALIAGKIYGAPQQRTGKNGSAFVTAKARCASGEGDGVFINVIAFGADTCHALMALEDGDAVSMAGTLTPKVWTDKDGVAHPALDIVAHQILTAYHVQRKRKASDSRNRSGDDVPMNEDF